MIYHITYLHISGPKEFKTDSIWEFSQRLDSIIDNRENSLNTIKIWTEKK